MSVHRLSNNIFLLRHEPSRAGAYVEITPSTKDQANTTTSAGTASGVNECIAWGAKNSKPNEMHAIATDNDTKWQLLETRRDFIVGLGLRFGTMVEGKPVPLEAKHKNFSEIKDFNDVLTETGYYIDGAMQACYSGQVFSQFDFAASNGKLLPFSLRDCFETRYRALQAGEHRLSAFLLNPNFGTKAYKKDESVAVPIYDPLRPDAYPSAIYHAKHRLPGQPFYSFPAWWGTKAWTEVANKIPAYHISGLTNGYNIKYLIRIPDDYFDKEGLETDEERQAFQDEVLQQMKESLAGESDRAVVTFYKHDISQMKSLPGVEIIPMKNTMTDDAYVQLYNTANQAQASGHGILPALAGVDTGGKLGGSGKELEVAANFQQRFRTYSDRQLLLRPLWIARRLNGWDPAVEFWFENIEVYTPDVTPTDAAVNPNNPDNQEQKPAKKPKKDDGGTTNQ
ncbi:hypothetical protein [Fibrella aquatilis]|uniref:Phage portal protein n=1 Tax=Fibrella aquatilis TaxID=2817059 RepID=A0A939K2B9_9BACT|nr:hypothetical protein [Fibrella aquatilis]MBO0933926.1 hypothetical protein [Fibrella aquatilis]